MASIRFPWDLEEEILSRLPARSLVRMRTVCKEWNALYNDRRFVNKHLARARPQFIFVTESKKMYSIEIDLGGTIEKRELPYDFHYQPTMSIYSTITACDGLLFREFWKEGVAVWNPWLRQVGWIKYEHEGFHLCGVGYDNSRPEKGYKLLGFTCTGNDEEGGNRFAMYDCASQVWKFVDRPSSLMPPLITSSVNGNLYWVAYNEETNEYYIRSFDFSKDILKPFCLLPYGINSSGMSRLLLAVYKEDRLSLLNQCLKTRNTEIWVTKTKIDGEEQVVWIKLMNLPTTNLPRLRKTRVGYFIFDKTLILCYKDGETGAACIYMARADMFKKIQIDSETISFSHCVYLPSLISVPLEFRSHQV